MKTNFPVHLVFYLLFVIILTGCGGNAQPVIVTLGRSPTFTAGTTMTNAPVVASAPTTALVAAATATRQPTTPTPGPSPTSLLAPTVIPAPETLTATRAPTLSGLSVEYFTTDTSSVRPGDNVTLYWSVRGAQQANIYRIDETGERIYRWDVQAEGKITVATRAGDRDAARFLLTVGNQGSSTEQELLIPLQCPEIWFFDPAPDACAADLPESSAQVEQTFERGRMIWVQTTDIIYVIFEDGGSPGWAQYPDNFNDGDPERDESLIPPGNLIQPVRGFGLVWRSNERIKERLGWATSPEVPFEGMYQSNSAEPTIATLFMRMRDGGILALDAETQDWEVLPPPLNDGVE